MESIIQRVEDEDLVISLELLRQLGVKPGDTVEIRRVPETEQVVAAPHDRARQLEVLRSLRGIWSDEDEEVFERKRKEMWETWQSSASS